MLTLWRPKSFATWNFDGGLSLWLILGQKCHSAWLSGHSKTCQIWSLDTPGSGIDAYGEWGGALTCRTGCIGCGLCIARSLSDNVVGEMWPSRINLGSSDMGNGIHIFGKRNGDKLRLCGVDEKSTGPFAIDRLHKSWLGSRRPLDTGLR